jgi:ABC-2 type transport system ATP-binding protein
LKEPELILFQEPLFDLDKDGVKIIIENIEELCLNGTAVLSTSVSFKDVMILGGQSYILDENGLRETQELKESTEEINDRDEDKIPVYKIEKIPAKLEERILLFDPVEIDYIESEQGISNLNVRGEKFPCTLSLNELESRLECLGFFRCHRSYLVNLQRVREVITWTRNSYSLSLDDKVKSSVPLSKGRMEELRKALKI